MRIGGIQKNSLIDYPKKISCVIFAAGCNFHCPYCHNPDLVRPSARVTLLDPSEIISFLHNRKTFLDGVVISGGEPTLQAELFDFCKRIKDMGYPVKLDTNGSHPEVLWKLIHKGLVDYIAMDIKTTPKHYAPHIAQRADPVAIHAAIQTIIHSGIPHEFRTTCIKPIVNENDIRRIANLIQGADLYVLQKARLQESPVLNPKFFSPFHWQVEDQEMETFRAIAANAVRACMIR